MDAGGLTMAVLSVSGPGADLLPPAEAVPWAVEANDTLAAAVRKHPTRFAGFAHLPTTDPAASAAELERCVTRLGFVGALINGLTDDQFLDHPQFDPILSAAERLDVPIYIHPNIPPRGRPARLTTATCPNRSAFSCRSPVSAGTPRPPSTCSASSSAALWIVTRS